MQKTSALASWLMIVALALLSNMTYAAPASPAVRIISTDAGTTELILALGAGDALIAVDVTSQLPEDFPELPNVGYHRNLSAEGLLALKPTVVVGSEHIGPNNVIRALQRADVTVLQLATANHPEELRANIHALAAPLGRSDEAQYLVEQLDRKLSELTEHRLNGLRAAFLLATDPNRLRLAGEHTAGAALLHLIGATNVVTYANYRTVSIEALLALRPELLLVAGPDPEQDVARLVASHSSLSHTRTGDHNRILGVDGGSLVAGLSLSAIDEALRLVQQLEHHH